MASSKDLLGPRKLRSMPNIPPTMSELIIVLLGENVPLNSRVGNFILGRSAFECDDPPPSVKLNNEKASGHVEGRTVTIINTAHLYNPHLSEEELTRKVKECICLTDPGPHVFLLVLQSKLIKHAQEDRVRRVLETYSPQSRKRLIMLTTGQDHGFISGCEVRNHRIKNLSTFDKHEVLQLLEKIDVMIKETGRSGLQERKPSVTERRPQDYLTEITPKTDREKNKGSDLRIILMGKSLSDTSRVGNSILGRSAFETEVSLHSGALQCERVRGHVIGRSITIINASHLLQQNLSHHQLTLCIKECVFLSAPGPHVIMLVVQPDSFTEADKRRVDTIFSSLSEEANKYTMVLTTKNTEISTSAVQDMENVLEKIIAECNYRHLNVSESSQATLVGKMEEMVRENKGSLVCEIYEDADSAVDQEVSKQITYQPQYQETKQEHFQIRSPAINLPVFFHNFNLPINQHIVSKQSSHWKLVLLGIEEIKASISKILLGKKALPVQTESSLMCVKKGELCGQEIMLVEMPALQNTRLSEQEVMCQTLQCVSVCHPGVHVFFIIISKVSFTDDAKSEIQMIRRIFGFRVKDHIIFIINQQSQEAQLDKDLQYEIEACGGRYILYSSETDDKILFDCIQNLLKENSNRQYTMTMYSDAQVETQLQYRSEIKKLQQQVCELKESNVNQTQDLFNNADTLRIVLLGRTGAGKSASGNTILGKNVFKEVFSDQSGTTVCQSHSEEIGGRQITVIDTPGLFDTNIDNDYTKKEIGKCIGLAAPGPHVFLLVLNITQRFTAEERETVKIIEKMFGTKSSIYTIVIFTGGDMLKHKEQTIEQYLEGAGPNLITLIRTCGSRYHVLNNMDKTSNTQVLHLLDKIDSMVKVNGGTCYTNEMFQQAEEALEEEKQRILKKREEQIEREKEELKAKHEAEMEKMRKEMQQQKERQEEEGRRIEEEFKRKEEEIKKETAGREQQLREDFRKRKEDDDLKIKEWREEINREREETRKQWESQREEYQKQREQEEEERRRKEEEWKKQKIEETERFKRDKEEMKRNKEEELKKLELEYKQKAEEEDSKRKDLEEKIKDAEESKKKQLQDLQLSQQREWERWRKEEEKRGKEQQDDWAKRIAAMEEKWNLDQIRKQKNYEWERQKEKEERDLKEKERNEKEEQEKRRIENEYKDKIHNKEEELEVQRERYEMERKKKDEEHKKEMEEKLQKQQENFRKEKEEGERKQNEERERILAYMEEQHKKEQENLKRDTEKGARKQAEQEFTAKLEEKVEKAKQEGFIMGCEKVESERSVLGRAVDGLINNFY